LKNRATSGFDRTHNIEIFGNYLAPFGKGQAYLQHGPAGYILGGWEIAGSMSKESGTPFTITGSGTSLGSNTANLSQVADVVGKSNMILGVVGHKINTPGVTYFNTANFKDPSVAENALGLGTCSSVSGTANALNVCRYGTAGRNSLRGPGFFNASISLGRQFRLTDRYSFTSRCEAMNFTNTPSFGNPDAGVTDGAFGEITGMASNYAPRTVRLSGRITF